MLNGLIVLAKSSNLNHVLANTNFPDYFYFIQHKQAYETHFKHATGFMLNFQINVFAKESKTTYRFQPTE